MEWPPNKQEQKDWVIRSSARLANDLGIVLGANGTSYDFCEWRTRFRRLGFSENTVHGQLHFISGFRTWLRRKGQTLAHARESDALEYLREMPKSGYNTSGPPALRRLFELLRENGILPRLRKAAPNSLENFISEYSAYAEANYGHSPITIKSYSRRIRLFISKEFEGDPQKLRSLSPMWLVTYIEKKIENCRPTIRSNLPAIRSLLRFLFIKNWTKQDLRTALPSVALWQHSNLPKFLETEKLRKLLRYIKLNGKSRKRDYAIALLLARLGLRGVEIIRLKLEDIDWEAMEITVSGKGSSERMPLPADAAAAIASYLKTERPKCASRSVFLCLKAPHREFTDTSALSNIVRRALERAGIHADST